MSCTPVIVAKRTSGTAPTPVQFHALNSSSTNISDVFRGALFYWDFGDAAGSPISGTTWAYGSLPGVSSRNSAFGPVAGHVFENSGTFTVTLYMYDGVEWGSTTETITITAADTTYSGTNTVCYSNDADFTGAPSGSTQITSSSWDTARAAIQANRRILLKRGDTFTFSGPGVVGDISANGPWQVGAFGTGANPILQATANTIVAMPGPSNSPSGQRSNVVWMDLQVDPNGHSGIFVGRHSDQPGPNTNFDNILYLRCSTVSKTSEGIYDYESDGNCIVDCNIDATNYTVFINSLIPMSVSTDCMVLGSRLTNDPSAGPNNGHTTRFIYVQRFLMADSHIEGGQAFNYLVKLAGKANFASDADYAEHIVLTRNKLVGSTGSGSGNMMALISVNDFTDYRTRRALIEANHFVPTTLNAGCLIAGDGNTFCIRNNLFDISGSHDTGYAAAVGVVLFKFYTGGSPMPDDFHVYNNTTYSSRATEGGFIPTTLRFDSAVTNVLARNNLMYTPNATNGIFDSGTAGSGYSQSNNTADADTDGVDPVFTGGGTTSMSQFAIQTTSPYKSFGTSVPVWADAFGIFRPQGAGYDGGLSEFDEGDQFPWETGAESATPTEHRPHARRMIGLIPQRF